jgi:hypothetical protein
MVQLLGYVNLALAAIILFFVVYIWMLDSRLRSRLSSMDKHAKVQEVKKSELVVDETYKDIYKQQTFNFKVEDFFISDIYKEIPEDARGEKVQEDYFEMFTKAIDSIMSNIRFFTNGYNTLNNPSSLQYTTSYLPVVKLAKFSVDYDGYLSQTSQRQFMVRVETQYPKFGTDEKYFVVLDNGKCKKRVHILYFIQKGLQLYVNHKVDVDNCIYYGKCSPPPKPIAADDTCKL